MEDSGSRLSTRQDFPHLTDAHWATLEKMVSPLAKQPSLDFPTSPESSRGRASFGDATEAPSAEQASATNTASFAARPTTTKPVKMPVPTLDGKESDSLVLWIREIEIALSAGQIYDARAQVAFALSNLGGRARAWAMARETVTPGHFTSWSFMEQELRSTFLLANVAYRHCSNWLRCKQGKRTLQDYVMELHNLEAAMAGAPLSENVKVTVFMDGVRTGPVRTELFRRQPTTFNEAVHIAMLEDHCVHSAHGHTPQVEASEGPTPMEISLAESARSQRTQTAGARCFGCNQPGHFRRNCPTNPWKATRDKKHPVRSREGYPKPMTVLIDSGASFNFATKASVARKPALYASALEASKINTNVSVHLATGSIVFTRKVNMPLSVKFIGLNSVEPFIVLDMDNRYDLIIGMTWLAKHEPWIDWRCRTIGARHNPLADRALAGHVPPLPEMGLGMSTVSHTVKGSLPALLRSWNCQQHRLHERGSPRWVMERIRGTLIPPRCEGRVLQFATELHLSKGHTPTQSVVAGSAHVEECAGVMARANKSGRVGTPTTQGVVAGPARATEDAGACDRATMSGRAGAPTSKIIRGDKVTSTPKAAASSHDADSAAVDRVPSVLDVFTSEHKVGEVLTPLPTVAELLELEELSYVEVLDSLKAGDLAEVVLLRPQGSALELNSSSVMASEVLEDERTSRRQTRYGAAILKGPSICNKVSMTCMLTLKERGTWSRTS
ncbi:unnamed protein product [Phytophthora fragariaefolia]|uniref:Unnamed protein product n=1 Tax=Phytophthora fragariaefolia TaxID=1490495 RepID=A0A9W7D2Z6_9STRA|nr:unnamed protein product [Phytophthora fragariaefolia]